jgi:hypothetical protein
MATLRDAAHVAQRMEELAARLQSELTDGDVDFTAMMRLADELGESADALASTFAAMDEALMQRLPGRATDDESRRADTRQEQESRRANEGGTRRQRQRQRREQPARRGDDGEEESETKDELLERAREAGIEGRSAMSKEDLRKAVMAAESLSKEELLERAREADIPGRSEMSKEELKEALRSSER